MTRPSAPDCEQRLADFESADFNELRPGQRLVLAKYAAEHLETPDLAIEMPTGEGKTLLALLIADYALDQGQSVAYLTAHGSSPSVSRRRPTSSGSKWCGSRPGTTAGRSWTIITRRRPSVS